MATLYRETYASLIRAAGDAASSSSLHDSRDDPLVDSEGYSPLAGPLSPLVSPTQVHLTRGATIRLGMGQAFTHDHGSAGAAVRGDTGTMSPGEDDGDGPQHRMSVVGLRYDLNIVHEYTIELMMSATAYSTIDTMVAGATAASPSAGSAADLVGLDAGSLGSGDRDTDGDDGGRGGGSGLEAFQPLQRSNSAPAVGGSSNTIDELHIDVNAAGPGPGLRLGAAWEAAAGVTAAVASSPISLTPLSFLPGTAIRRYLGPMQLYFFRESWTVRGNLQLAAFHQNFLEELDTQVQAQARALGGNAVVSLRIKALQGGGRSGAGQVWNMALVTGDVVFAENIDVSSTVAREPSATLTESSHVDEK